MSHHSFERDTRDLSAPIQTPFDLFHEKSRPVKQKDCIDIPSMVASSVLTTLLSDGIEECHIEIFTQHLMVKMQVTFHWGHSPLSLFVLISLPYQALSMKKGHTDDC